MDKIRQLVSKAWVAAAIGFVIGLIIGLPVLGWGLYPVTWTDAAPQHLRQDVKVDYLRMSIDSFAVNHDAGLAQQRYQSLGSTAPDLLSALKNDSKIDQKALAQYSAAVTGKAVAVATGPAATQVAGTPAAKPTKTKASKNSATPKAGAASATPAAGAAGKSTATLTSQQLVEQLLTGTPTAGVLVPVATAKPTNFLVTVLGVLCAAVLIVGAVLLYIFVFRKGKGPSKNQSLAAQASDVSKAAIKTDFGAQGQEAPIAQFMSTYMLGDDLYDDSFSIDSPTGEFLGECGVGISDTIGVGDPKKVTAFEVWLFDKNDIQTVTKVLMSEHAYNDPTIRQRLASKGEPVLIGPDKKVLLETATLSLEARVVDMNYGSGALPQNSFFERLTLELAVWPKQKPQ
jgi:cytoskeletal protein RodZ